MLKTGEDSGGNGIYDVSARRLASSGIVLKRELSADAAHKYIDNLRIEINGSRVSSGRPIITKTVSPEAFDKLKKQLDKTTLSLSAAMAILLMAVKDGDIIKGDKELTALAMKRLQTLGSTLVQFLPDDLTWEDITWGDGA